MQNIVQYIFPDLRYAEKKINLTLLLLKQEHCIRLCEVHKNIADWLCYQKLFLKHSEVYLLNGLNNTISQTLLGKGGCKN